MEHTTLHPELEMRVRILGARVRTLRRWMSRAADLQRILKRAELVDLEHRHKALEERLRRLDRDGPGVLQSMKAEFILLADDLTGTIDRLVLSIDEHFQAKENSRLPTGAAARHRRAKAPDSDVGRKGA